MSNTLFGGKTITVKVIGPDNTLADEPVTVQQIKVKDYESAIKVYDKELELHALICGKTLDWIGTVEPESYELIVTTAEEVNGKGFFTFAARKQTVLTAKINSIKPELVEMASKRTLPASVPGLRPV